tara:strand:- start:636 stop:2297 length:1662 start_codon:yes stop_codon:yes gene_type:complete
MAANIFHGCTFYDNKRGYVVAHDVDTTDTLFKMHKVFYENLDEAVTPMVRFSNKKELLFENPDSQQRKKNPGLRSSITVRAASSGGKRVSAEQGAAGVGRGDRIDYFHGSEVAFWPNGEETFTGFAQAVPEEPNTIISMESTANGMAGFFYEEWLRASSGDQDSYTPIFIPWFEHPHYRASYVSRTRPEWVPTDYELKSYEEYQGSVLANLDAQAEKIGAKLGLDDEEAMLSRRFGIGWDQLKWRRWCIKFRCSGKVANFHTEYPSFAEEAFAASGTPRFNNEKIRVLFDNCRIPTPGSVVPKDDTWQWETDAWIPCDMSFDGQMKGWLNVIEPPREGHEYVIGADISHGLGRDYSALAVFDRTEKRFVAYSRDNDIKPDKVAEYMILAGMFYNWAFLVPEFNGPGVLTTHLIVKSNYPRLYYSQRFNTATQRYTDQPGFNTDQKTRGRIIDMFDVALENDAVEIPIKAILDETLTFVLDGRRGRADHLPGCHDDLLFAAMIAYFIDDLAPMGTGQKEAEPSVLSWGHGPPRADEIIPSGDDIRPEDIEMMFL